MKIALVKGFFFRENNKKSERNINTHGDPRWCAVDGETGASETIYRYNCLLVSKVFIFFVQRNFYFNMFTVLCTMYSRTSLIARNLSALRTSNPHHKFWRSWWGA